jgi:FkbM family methyltransferase
MKPLGATLWSAKNFARPPYHWLRRTINGVRFLEPNYLYLDWFNSSSIVVDVGCGHAAEFSKYLVRKYNLHAFGVDPTLKHAPFLRAIEQASRGNFRHLALAVTKQAGPVTFYESNQNESGSILAEHANIVRDSTRSYQVESVDLPALVGKIGARPIDFIKLDLEGAEYGLLADATESDLKYFNQVFVEFHDHCTNYTFLETQAIVDRVRGLGFKVFTLDKHNYLFHR